MSTTTTVKVNASEMAAFQARYPNGPNGDTGATIAEAAKAGGYKSTGAAGNAIRKVRDAMLAGSEIVLTDGDGEGSVVTTDATAKVVDRLAIADGMVPGASMVVDAVDKLRQQQKTLRDRIDALTADIGKVDDTIAQRLAFASAGGFDWDAFEDAVAKATDADDATSDDN